MNILVRGSPVFSSVFVSRVIFFYDEKSSKLHSIEMDNAACTVRLLADDAANGSSVSLHERRITSKK